MTLTLKFTLPKDSTKMKVELEELGIVCANIPGVEMVESSPGAAAEGRSEMG